MGDLFYSRETGLNGRKASGGLRRSAGINDEYASRIGAMLVRERSAPFNLVYFFKGDSIAHHHGLEAQRRWLRTADGYVGRIFAAAGGVDRLLEDYAVLALSDHGHAPLLPGRRHVDLRRVLGLKVSSGIKARFGRNDDAVVVPNGRSALIYLRDGIGRGPLATDLVGRRGVDLAAWAEDGWGNALGAGGLLKFRPGPGPADPFGRTWELGRRPGRARHRGGGRGDTLRGLPRRPGAAVGLHARAPVRGRGALRGAGVHVRRGLGGVPQGERPRLAPRRDSNVFVLAGGFEEAAPRRITDVAPMLLEHFGTGRIAQPSVL
jgi:hypothetical protein